MLAVRVSTHTRRSDFNLQRSSHLSFQSVHGLVYTQRGFADQSNNKPNQPNQSNNNSTDRAKDEFVRTEHTPTTLSGEPKLKITTYEEQLKQDEKRIAEKQTPKVIKGIQPVFLTTIRLIDKVLILARPALKLGRKGVDFIADAAETGENKLRAALRSLAKKYPWVGYMLFMDVENRVQQLEPLETQFPTEHQLPPQDYSTKATRLHKDYYYQRAGYLVKEGVPDKSVIIKVEGKPADYEWRNLNAVPGDHHYFPARTWMYMDARTNKTTTPLQLESLQSFWSNAQYIERTIEVSEAEYQEMQRQREREAEIVYAHVSDTVKKQREEDERLKRYYDFSQRTEEEERVLIELEEMEAKRHTHGVTQPK